MLRLLYCSKMVWFKVNSAKCDATKSTNKRNCRAISSRHMTWHSLSFCIWCDVLFCVVELREFLKLFRLRCSSIQTKHKIFFGFLPSGKKNIWDLDFFPVRSEFLTKHSPRQKVWRLINYSCFVTLRAISFGEVEIPYSNYGWHCDNTRIVTPYI